MNEWDDVQRALEQELGEPCTIDALTRDWRIAQRAAGHRHSADDVLTADYALRVGGAPDRVLDLGSGIGGVGLLVLWGLPRATLVCIEAQEVSYRLLRANIAGNRLADRVVAHHGDLRELALAEKFPLVTGSPPYFPLGTGIVPADSQKAHARFELRGDIGDYAKAAARHLTDDGVCVLCFPTAQRQRALDSIGASGLVVTSYRDVIPRATLRPLFTVFAAKRSGTLTIEEPFVVREANGELTAAMQSVRRRFGF